MASTSSCSCSFSSSLFPYSVASVRIQFSLDFVIPLEPSPVLWGNLKWLTRELSDGIPIEEPDGEKLELGFSCGGWGSSAKTSLFSLILLLGILTFYMVDIHLFKEHFAFVRHPYPLPSPGHTHWTGRLKVFLEISVKKSPLAFQKWRMNPTLPHFLFEWNQGYFATTAPSSSQFPSRSPVFSICLLGFASSLLGKPQRRTGFHYRDMILSYIFTSPNSSLI